MRLYREEGRVEKKKRISKKKSSKTGSSSIAEYVRSKKLNDSVEDYAALMTSIVSTAANFTSPDKKSFRPNPLSFNLPKDFWITSLTNHFSDTFSSSSEQRNAETKTIGFRIKGLMF